MYEECKSLIDKSMLHLVDESVTDLVGFGENNCVHVTLPNFIRHEVVLRAKVVYYISDLHIVNHIIDKYPDGASNDQIKKYVHDIVLQLFTGDFDGDVKHFQSPIVIFGGDVSSSFSIAKLFYIDFIETWNTKVNDKYNLLCKELDPINDELNQLKKQLSDWEKKHPWIKNIQKPIAEYSDKKIPSEIKALFIRTEELKEKYRKRYNELGGFWHWKEYYEKLSNHRYIYAIIGNHELWDFNNYEECVNAYRRFFKKMGIRFLCDEYGWLGVSNSKYLLDYNNGSKNRNIQKHNESGFYEEEKAFFIDNILVVGGMGFAGLNTTFNAKQGIYRKAVSRSEERKRSKEWKKLFLEAYSVAQRTHSCLLVLTHMPISDWGGDLESISNCIFINGHTHRNIAYGDENNNFVYADNQIGYHKNSFSFKRVTLHVPRNPFAIDSDGYREITCDEYIEYYRYIQERIPGTGTIERQISNSNAKLFVMKQDGYVAFFLVSSKGVYICNGGSIKKIGPYESLGRYYMNFKLMINKYITALTPIRHAQEKLSSYIKSFGGSGRIHGTIVDIDFYNHIMLNTVDGSVTIYNSPIFGLVKPYPDIESLLHVHCPELEEKYKKIGSAQMGLVVSEFKNVKGDYEQVDIKNSPYAVSRKVNALQRLLTKRVLRDWNPAMEEVVTYIDSIPG